MLIAVILLFGTANAMAQEFSRFLQCRGSLQGTDKNLPAYADFAMRFNNRTALIQRSNLLPVGERLAFVPTPALYSMTYRLRAQGTRIVTVPSWISSTILVVRPDLQRLNQIRISIDRQTGVLDGTILNEDEQPLAQFQMQCDAKREDEIPAPKL